jgi:mono/diheme cytochrome c family protein
MLPPAVLLLGILVAVLSTTSAQMSAGQELQSPSAFQSIGDRAQRSRAVFAEIGKVLTHPRCMNCHPVGDQPLQGADHRIHFPPARRAGPGDSCAACHTDRNVTLHVTASFQSIPGHPRWALAPLSMAWEGKSLGDICRQIKDEDRNGGRDLALLQEHIAKDDLVAWGWNPGAGREPAPGSQDLAGLLVQAWIDSGAECP